jgi:hypothetical protein
MNRRPRLPGADELFRATAGAAHSAGAAAAQAPESSPTASRGSAALATPPRTPRVSRTLEPTVGWDADADPADAPSSARGSDIADDIDGAPSDFFEDQRGPSATRGRPVRIARRGDSRPTGRERHDEKITVYCSPEELVQLEHARLALRASHGLAVDRGRIVREAVAVVLADLEAKGDASILVRRLRGR